MSRAQDSQFICAIAAETQATTAISLQGTEAQGGARTIPQMARTQHLQGAVLV